MLSRSLAGIVAIWAGIGLENCALAVTLDSASNGTPTAQTLALNIADTTNGVTVVAASANFTINAAGNPSSSLQSIGSFTNGNTAPGTPLPPVNDPAGNTTYAGGIDLSTGVCLCTGFVSDSEQTSPAGRGVGVEGPNNGIGGPHAGEIGAILGTPVDQDFALATGLPGGGDATVLQFDVTTVLPGFLRIRFVFGSDENPFYIMEPFNDSFAIFIGGENVATITKYSAVLPFSLQEVASCPQIFRQNNTAPFPTILTSDGHEIPSAPRFNVEFGGFTAALGRETCNVLPPGTYRVKIVVQDVADQTVDAGLFVGENSLKLFDFLKGDANLDGSVGQSDLDAVLLHWGETGVCYTEGDLDGDGSVGMGDQDLVLLNWGNTGGNTNFCADFNRDNDVDGHDFAIWQQNFGLTQCASRAEGDADRDGDVDGDDLAIYNSEFGGTPSGACLCCGGQQRAMAGGGGESAASSESLVQAHLDHLDIDEDQDFDDDDISLWKSRLGGAKE